ncbi:alkaline phosphatase D family protein [Sphingobium sp. AN641]|uniref:alkaline phosphatase D family protein n=1 Tax=Sphingobium sp. AN641 TaxID=3133443 RepID=UPI0030C626CA
MLSRRQIIAASLAVPTLAAPAIVRAQGWFRAYPFSLGITSGDPSPDGFVIWTRLAPDPAEAHGGMPMSPVPVTWDVSADTDFKTIAAKGEAIAWPEMGHSVHVEVKGLQADRPYWYRFFCGGRKSIRGRARTMPLPGAALQSLRFGVAGCMNYEDGLYTAMAALAREDLSFVFHYGDFIYEAESWHGQPGYSGLPAPKVRRHAGQNLTDIADFRLRYAQYLSDYDLQSARSWQTWFSTFDDHEVQNNWVGEFAQDATPSEIFALRRAAGLQAWYEHMPVRAALRPNFGRTQAYRAARYGDLLTMNFLDTRSFRSDQPCNDGFAPRCVDVGAAQAQVMGAAQEKWLFANLARKDSRWSCLAQQVMMMALDRRTRGEPEKILNLDSWAAYEAPRERLLARLRGLNNVVVLTGDEHQNFAGLLYDRDVPVAVEFVSTSISSGGNGQDLRPGSDKILAANPQLAFLNDQRGYLTCDVTPDEWRTNIMVMDQVAQPGGTLSKRATLTVPHGNPSLSVG